MNKLFALGLSISLTLCCLLGFGETVAAKNGDFPVAILLFIGDGMGEAHRTAAQWFSVGQEGRLSMDQLPVRGWIQTASANNLVTDSAAAATAMATGQKTNNNMVAVDPSGMPLTTILEIAQEMRLDVGLITNVQMAHATPAPFASHVESRGQMTEIASQMLEHKPNVLLGGGENVFLPTWEIGCYEEEGERTDGRNLIEEAVANGYLYTCDSIAFDEAPTITTTHKLGLFGDEGIAHPYQPTLVEMTDKAIQILSQNPRGFFLMVEGGKIDWYAEDNDTEEVIFYTLDFDAAVQAGMQYAATNPNTLLIVTGDHETGGMSVSLTPNEEQDDDGPFYMPDGTPFYISWTSDYHTGVDVPLTASGPYSQLLEGTHDNTFIFDVMRQMVGWRVWLPFVVQ